MVPAQEFLDIRISASLAGESKKMSLGLTNKSKRSLEPHKIIKRVLVTGKMIGTVLLDQKGILLLKFMCGRHYQF